MLSIFWFGRWTWAISIAMWNWEDFLKQCLSLSCRPFRCFSFFCGRGRLFWWNFRWLSGIPELYYLYDIGTSPLSFVTFFNEIFYFSLIDRNSFDSFFEVLVIACIKSRIFHCKLPHCLPHLNSYAQTYFLINFFHLLPAEKSHSLSIFIDTRGETERSGYYPPLARSIISFIYKQLWANSGSFEYFSKAEANYYCSISCFSKTTFYLN